MAPIRVQRKRTKGWKMPENTVYVGRPTKWGNPFKIGDIVSGFGKIKDNSDLCEVFNSWIKLRLSGACGERPEWGGEMKKNLTELQGKNLACWCGLGEDCHADILLKLANNN